MQSPLDASDPMWKSLIDETIKGNVVAFVGAGIFGSPPPTPSTAHFRGLPTWGSLMELLIEELEKNPPSDVTAETIKELRFLNEKKDYVPLAQYLEDKLSNFESVVKEKLNVDDLSDLHPAVQRRLLFLRGIPFRGILTTNFTDCFPLAQSIVDGDGECDFKPFLRNTTQGNTFNNLRLESVEREIKRLEDLETLQEENAATLKKEDMPCLDLSGDTPVIHVHGKNKPVLTRRAYRTLLHRTPTYLPFMRSVFSTCTVLFIGFSMSDEYVKELLSETLALVSDVSSRPCFAVLSDKTSTEVEYLRKHDGIQVFAYDTHGYTDFSYVDKFLEGLYKNTSFPHQLAAQLYGKRILSIERPLSQSENSGFWVIADYLSRLATAADGSTRNKLAKLTSAGSGGSGGGGAAGGLFLAAQPQSGSTRKYSLPGGGVIEVSDDMGVFEERVKAGGSWDAFVSYFGYNGADEPPTLIDVLGVIRREPFKSWAPTIVFASSIHEEENSKIVQKCGCVAYTFEWSSLLHALTVALGKGGVFTVSRK